MAGTSEVAVKFTADTAQIRKAADDVKGHTSRISGYALAAGAALGAMLSVRAVSGFIDAAQEAEVASARLAKTLQNAGDTSGDWTKNAEKLADSLMRQTGIDDEIIKGGQAILATFHDVGGVVGQQAGIFDRATKATADLAKTGFGDVDTAAKQLGKALQDPVNGIGALKRAGVDFTDEQKNMIKALVDSGDKAGAMGLVMDVVEGQVGGVAAATATAGDKMSAAWGEIQEAIGKLLLPALEVLAPVLVSLSDWFEQTAIPAIDGFAGAVADVLGPALGDIVDFINGTLLPAVGDVAGKFAEWAGPAVQGVVDWINNNLLPAFGNVVDWVNNKLLPSFADVGDKLSEPFQKAAKAAGETSNWQGFLTTMRTVGGALRTAAGFVEDFAKGFGDRFGPALRDAASSVADFVRFFTERFSRIAQAVQNVLTPVILIVAAVVKTIMFLWSQFNDQIIAIVSFAWATITNTIDTAMRIIGDLFDFILNLLTGNWGDAWAAIADIPVAVFDGMRDLFGSFLTFVVDFFASLPGNLAGAIGAILTFFADFGGRVLYYLEYPFIAAYQWVADHVGDIPSALAAVPGLIGGVLEGIYDAITSPFVLAFNAIVDLWNNTVGRISFTIPDWVPGIGGEKFSVPNLPHVGESGRVGGGGGLSLRMAEGGIVTGPTVALLGEAGHEAVLPLDRLGNMGGNTYIINVTTTGLGADSPQVARDIVSALDQHTSRNGPLASSITGR